MCAGAGMARRLVLNGLTAEVIGGGAPASPDSLDCYHELELYRQLLALPEPSDPPPTNPAHANQRRARTPSPVRTRQTECTPAPRRARTPAPRRVPTSPLSPKPPLLSPKPPLPPPNAQARPAKNVQKKMTLRQSYSKLPDPHPDADPDPEPDLDPDTYLDLDPDPDSDPDPDPARTQT
ncbi:protein TsetseEP-like [Pectinophora gossypiella]|uniref:protein TsetseEP-like n=1 Tax=Pectinophora gossypiella TaxID=13191 RepID=UPI00214F1E47|nr:protein TsetseEP-like [Pectinophora gossypiella]